MDKNYLIELWLDSATLTYSSYSFLNFKSVNPTSNYADSILFFNSTPKEDFFEGRLDAVLNLRAVYQGKEISFVYSHPNLSVSGKILQIKCRGGKVTQAKLMMDWVSLLDADNYDKKELLRYPIEGKYRLHSGSCDIVGLTHQIKHLADFSDVNPHFLESEIRRIIADKRFWMRGKLTIKGNLPTTCYLPSVSQQT